ncbi:hypothetical protein NPS29_12115 [Pseudomonas putida]|uniref:hypothetical protein n=1 Tax=Pseudomonas putida TaxID=303 RepID=UPI0023644EE8|nr:hypothetical protein [Pseudomonas putida]MDD1966065.1 hypothetical protein [Pseudomonas putida]
MNLNYTQNLHGILSGSTLLDEASSESCRMVLHKGTLYCAYLSGGEIRLSSRQSSSAQWSLGTPSTGLVSTSLPGLASFKGQLVIVYKNTYGNIAVCKYNETAQTFIQTAVLTDGLSQTPTFSVLNGVLFMFYKHPGFSSVFYRTTANLVTWTTWKVLQKDKDINISTFLSPVATLYQNLIHLIYEDRDDKKVYLLKSDGENWTSSILLINKRYGHSPGLAVHNGLLKLIFIGKNNRLDQYTYDGNAFSPAIPSNGLLCGSGSPALAVQDGALVTVFPGYVPPPTASAS